MKITNAAVELKQKAIKHVFAGKMALKELSKSDFINIIILKVVSLK